MQGSARPAAQDGWSTNAGRATYRDLKGAGLASRVSMGKEGGSSDAENEMQGKRVSSILSQERQQRDAKLEEVRRLDELNPEEPHRMTHEATTHVARLRAYIAQGRVRALEAGAHPHKPCGEPRYPSGD